MSKLKKASIFVGMMLILSAVYPFFRASLNKDASVAADEIRLTKGAEVKHPALGQDFIVWIEYRGGAYNLYLYNFVTKEERKLNDAALSADTVGPAVFQSHVYWVDHTVDGWVLTEYDVFHTLLKKIKTENKAVRSLAVYENYLVYEAPSGVSSDVFILNKENGEIKNLSNDEAYQKAPSIFGNLVAWAEFSWVCGAAAQNSAECKASDRGRVVTYDLVSNVRTVIKDNLANLSEVKSQNLTLAWSELEGSTKVVKVYYVNTGVLVTVSPGDYHSFNPVFAPDLLLYFVQRGDGTDLEMYQFSTGRHTILSWTKAEKTEPTLGPTARYAAWLDNRLGTKDLFYYDALAEVTDKGTSVAMEKLDQDGDGLRDADETKYGTNLFDADTDHDGLSDYEEIFRYHTYPTQYDSDGDGIKDGDEINYWLSDPKKFDSNDDGIDDKTSVIQGFNPMASRQNLTLYRVHRMESLAEEKKLAEYLKRALDNYLGRGRWHTRGKSDWFKVVNAYLYGGYNIKEIAAYVKGDSHAISAETLATVWREERNLAKIQDIQAAIK
ncbi:MAG: hypothetical protein HY982_00290 [Candidatus Magasanikbacteria bacterium]|nr:hypothetical protein [Candidatus Magasanikbacteria bacterium]